MVRHRCGSILLRTGLAGVVISVAGATMPARAAGPPRPVWNAATVPSGVQALNLGHLASLDAVSCAAAGECTAVGSYTNNASAQLPLVAVERGGTWGLAMQLPGIQALNHGSAQANTVSCATAMNCAIGGQYTDTRNHVQPFVATERNGVWGAPTPVVGVARANLAGVAEVGGISCRAVGACTAAGNYETGQYTGGSFVVDEVGGRWQAARLLSSLGAPFLRRGSTLHTLTCAAAGSCVAAGYTYTCCSTDEAFVAVEQGGRWLVPTLVKGLHALGADGGTEVTDVSCAEVGRCVAVGDVTVGHGGALGFVIDQLGSGWSAAVAIPGQERLPGLTEEGANLIACSTPLDCTVVGQHSTATETIVVARSLGGRWGNVAILPFAPSTHANRLFQYPSGLACAAPGYCSVVGSFSNSAPHGGLFEAFVANQVAGAWRDAIETPGTPALNVGADAVGGASGNSIACPAVDRCSSVGNVQAPGEVVEPFVNVERPG